MTLLQTAAAAVPSVDTGLTATHAVNIEVQGHEISAISNRCSFAAEISTPVRQPISCREVEELLHLAALHGRSPRVEIESGAASPDDGSQTIVASRVAGDLGKGWLTVNNRRYMQRQPRRVRQDRRAMNIEQQRVGHFVRRQLIWNSCECL